jgi:hypothetical protein
VDEDHHVVEALHGVVRHIPTKHLPSQQRRRSLAPYRAHQPTLYAVRCGAALLLRFVDFDEGRLILRPYSRDFPVQLLPLATHETPADYIVGRVCLVFSEL